MMTSSTTRLRAAVSLGLAVARIAAIAALATACRPSPGAGDRNPFYVRGTELLNRGERDAAREAFEKCLRMAPNSPGAHLQLGMLYDNTYGDPLYALYHYHRFLELAPEDESADAVRRWIARAELDLVAARGTAVEPAAPGDAPSAPPPEKRGSSPTPMERALAERVKALNTEVLTLREELEAARAVAAAPRPAPRVTDTDAGRHQPGEPPPDTATRRTHRVRKGESLSSISRTYYGTLKYWPKLRDINRDVLKDGTTLVVGTLLRIPPEAELQTDSPVAAGPPPGSLP